MDGFKQEQTSLNKNGVFQTRIDKFRQNQTNQVKNRRVQTSVDEFEQDQTKSDTVGQDYTSLNMI